MRLRLSVLAALLIMASAFRMAFVVAASQGTSEKVDAAAIYDLRCSMCHGKDGDSTLQGMSFADGRWKHGNEVKEITAVIRDGV